MTPSVLGHETRQAEGVGQNLLKRYPVAAFAATGLLLGAVALAVRPAAAHAVFAVVATLGGLILVWSTLRNIIGGRFHVDAVAALAIVGSVLLGEYTAGAMVVLMQAGGEALEDYGLRRANRSLDNLLKRAPSVAHMRCAHGYTDIPAAEVGPGDVLLLRPGDIVPADGTVLDGCGNVDEAALTGEPVPLAKRPGDTVYSGTINLSGVLHVTATSSAAHSKYELIVRMVKHAQGERAPINRLANRYTPGFTVLTLFAAGVAWMISGDSVRALSVLVVATPCPLIIATPLAVLTAINRAASLNIITKSGAAIEQAGVVNAVLFDKTGTLTVGRPELAEVQLLKEAGGEVRCEADLLALAAGVELMSSHVLAEAVVRNAHRRRLDVIPATDVTESPGIGVRGRVGTLDVAVGAGRFLLSLGIHPSDRDRQTRAGLCATGKTVAYVAVNGAVAGLLAFEDTLRPEAGTLMARLRDMGISRTVLLTGDTEETANAVAARAGITEVQSGMQPEDKVRAVREVVGHEAAMMVGDGINDAPALAAATVGVAMGGHGAGIATDAADVVITVDNVERVADVIAIGRRMVSVARQGILFGIGASLVLMIIAGMGYIPPVAGAMLQEVLDLVTILNALRVR